MKNKIFLITIVLALFLAVSTSAVLENLNICDEQGGTSLVRDRVTVCQGNQVFRTVESVETLARTNSRPIYLENEGVTLLYFEPTEGDVKKVEVVLTLPVTPILPALPLGSISSNLLEGQGVMLRVGLGNTAEFYLLKHLVGEALFSPENLILEHIPTDREFLPNNFEGSNIYVFETIGDERISMQIRENEFKITSLQPGERPAAYVIPKNLADKYELTFTQSTPINEIGLGLGVLTVCQEDNPRDGQQIKICRAGEEFRNTGFTLQLNQLTKRNILGNNVVFLFEVVDGVKTVRLYALKTLSEVHDTFNYDNFINNMVEGRRVALEFSGNIYLLGHPRADFISLPQLQLEVFSNGERTVFPAVGSEGKVALPTIGGGAIFLERNYGNPPPPFELWALTPQQITPVNLEQELNTYVSSLGTKQFNVPNFGVIQKRGEDIARSANLFKLQDSIGNFDLQLNVPQERRVDDNSALLYYNSASLDGGISVKTAEVYLLYPVLSEEDDRPEGDRRAEHVFNDGFISTLTNGGQIALKFKSKYYLLYHENEQLENVFFNVDKLRLRTLNGDQTFTPATVGSEAKFTIPEGQIVVTVDEIANMIRFNGVSSESLVTSRLAGEDYTVVLDATPNQVEVDGTLLSMCNLGVYADVTSADVCFGRMSVLIETSKVMTFGGNTYLLEVNGQIGNQKKVTIRKVLQIEGRDSRIANWNTFVTHLRDNDVPIFNVSNGLYLPRVQTNSLNTFQLQKSPAGTVNSLRNIQAITQVTSNGTFVLPERVLFVEQKIEGFDARNQFISASFTARDYGFLPENGEAIEFNSSADGNVLRFVASLDGDVVEITNEQTEDRVVWLSINDIVGRWFAQGDVRVIVVNGVAIEIRVDAVEAEGVVLSVRRI
ncbi:MAG: hypothetical protein Q8Q01_03780 [archaeon]|nr:hypothetical protein [archaeon]